MLMFSCAFHLHDIPTIWEPAKRAKLQFTVIYGNINNNIKDPNAMFLCYIMNTFSHFLGPLNSLI